MCKCVLCGNEFEDREKNYYCSECGEKLKVIKRLKMIDNAEKTIDKKRILSGISKTEELTEYIDTVRERVLSGEDKFSSIPEVIVAIQMERINLKYETQKNLGGAMVDFYIPEIKIVLEIDGNIYHADENKQFLRDRRIMSSLGEKWEIVHIDSNKVPKYTWNLRESLPFVVTQRNDDFRFRNSEMDSDYLSDFMKLENYLKRNGG